MLVIMHCDGSLCRKQMAGSHNFNVIIREDPDDKSDTGQSLVKGEGKSHMNVQYREELPHRNKQGVEMYKGQEEGELHLVCI